MTVGPPPLPTLNSHFFFCRFLGIDFLPVFDSLQYTFLLTDRKARSASTTKG